MRMPLSNNRTPARSQRGLSLIEVMVGMAVGLIGITVITQVYLVNENFKRSTTSAGGAQVNGTLALYNLERDLRIAGAGVAHLTSLACPEIRYAVNGVYSPPAASSTLPTMFAAPVTIIQTSGLPDRVNVLYGTASDRAWPATLQQTMANFGANMTVDSFYGFTSGDLLMAAQSGVCTLTQLTATPVTATPTLQHNTSTSSIYNIAAGGTFTAYTTGALVFNLGAAPVSRTYAIASGNLTSGDVLAVAAGGSAQVLVNDIVDLRAQYGKDNGTDNSTVSHASFVANDGTIDSYDNTTPTTAAGWQQVLAVRFAVLARSSNYVKPESGVCSASPATLAWSGGTFTIPDRCYAYRVFETVVPLRNMIWRTV